LGTESRYEGQHGGNDDGAEDGARFHIHSERN
jgi:hypothetical protein